MMSGVFLSAILLLLLGSSEGLRDRLTKDEMKLVTKDAMDPLDNIPIPKVNIGEIPDACCCSYAAKRLLSKVAPLEELAAWEESEQMCCGNSKAGTVTCPSGSGSLAVVGGRVANICRARNVVPAIGRDGSLFDDKGNWKMDGGTCPDRCCCYSERQALGHMKWTCCDTDSVWCPGRYFQRDFQMCMFAREFSGRSTPIENDSTLAIKGSPIGPGGKSSYVWEGGCK